MENNDANLRSSEIARTLKEIDSLLSGSRPSIWDLPSPDIYQQLITDARKELMNGRHQKLLTYVNNEGDQLSSFIKSLGLQFLRSENVDGEGILVQLQSISGACPSELVEFFRLSSTYVESASTRDASEGAELEDRIHRQIEKIANSYERVSGSVADDGHEKWVVSALQSFHLLLTTGQVRYPTSR